MGIFLSMAPLCGVDQMVPLEATEQRPGACHLVMETSTVRWSKGDGRCGGTGFGVSIDASFLHLTLGRQRSLRPAERTQTILP